LQAILDRRPAENGASSYVFAAFTNATAEESPLR